jgi:hypothetical protein
MEHTTKTHRTPPKNPKDWLLFLAAAAPPAVVYGLTLAPSLTWAHSGADGGELLAAAATGGIPHPPGFPAYLLLAGLVLRLPVGDPAGRLNALSAAMAALAAGLVAVTAFRRAQAPTVPRWVAGLAAGWLLAFAPLVWSQAVITEVYTTAAAITAVLLLLSRARASPRVCLVIGLLFGLGLGVHPTLLFLAPLLVANLWPVRRSRLVLLVLGSLVGLVPYALLPLRAAAGPAVNWGNPSTVAGWWWLVSGTPYRGYFLALPPGEWPLRLLARAALLARELTPAGLPLAVYGWTCLWQRDRLRAAMEKAVVLALFAFSVAWGTSDSSMYLLPGLVLLAVWAGEAMAALAGRVWPADQKPRAAVDRGTPGGLPGALARLLGPRKAALVPLPFLLLLPLTLLAGGWAAADLHSDRGAVSFASAVLAQAPPRAILVSHADRHTFALWAQRYALGAGRLPGAATGEGRPDVSVVDADLLAFSWYRAALAAELALPGLVDDSDPWAALRAAGRPLCTVSDAGLGCEQPAVRTVENKTTGWLDCRVSDRIRAGGAR